MLSQELQALRQGSLNVMLSIGYINEKETYDPEVSGIDPIDTKHEYFYAGLNSFTETLRWENSLLKMGFIFTF